MSTLHAPSRIKTKKNLKEAVALFNETGESPGRFIDPSLYSDRSSWSLGEMLVADSSVIFYVTNHPKRSWFANIRVKNGKLVVQ